MKKLVLIIALACAAVFTSCQKLPAGTDSLAGYTFAAFEDSDLPHSSTVQNYYELQFLTNNTGKKFYVMTDGTSRTVQISYTYSHPNLKYMEGSTVKEGTVRDDKNVVYIDGITYTRKLGGK